MPVYSFLVTSFVYEIFLYSSVKNVWLFAEHCQSMCPLQDVSFLSEAELRSSLLKFDRVKDSYLKTVKQVTLREANI